MQIQNNYIYNNNYNPKPAVSFKGLGVTDCIRDALINKKFGKFVLNKLPKIIKNNRAKTIEEVSNYLLSDKYFSQVYAKNWEVPYGSAKVDVALDMLDMGGKDFVRERADILLTNSYLTLNDLYKGKSEIIIPYSGGRDSSSILAASLAFFPEKKYKLITVLNGMSSTPESVQKQAEYLTNMFTTKLHKPKVEIIFIDASDDIKKYVLDTAREDKEILGAPAICSGCKFVMEKKIWNYILQCREKLSKSYDKRKRGFAVLMGYNQNQAEQSWLEQSIIQRLITTHTADKYGIDLSSPFYNIIETPYDSRVLLSSLGIPLKRHKREMKCLAGGLNPNTIDLKKQTNFLLLKNNQTNAILSNNSFLTYNQYSTPIARNDLSDKILDLKSDKNFTDNVFIENK